MSDPKTPSPIDIQALWREQPEEPPSIPSPKAQAYRVTSIRAATHAEIVGALAAILLLDAVLVLRFGFTTLILITLALSILWAALTIRLLLLHPVWPTREDLISPGAEFYRRELQHRRKHLVKVWLWRGPLLLASITLAGVALSARNLVYLRLPQVLPLFLALSVWIFISVRRRRREAAAIQRELDELAQASAHAAP